MKICFLIFILINLFPISQSSLNYQVCSSTCFNSTAQSQEINFDNFPAIIKAHILKLYTVPKEGIFDTIMSFLEDQHDRFSQLHESYQCMAKKCYTNKQFQTLDYIHINCWEQTQLILNELKQVSDKYCKQECINKSIILNCIICIEGTDNLEILKKTLDLNYCLRRANTESQEIQKDLLLEELLSLMNNILL